MDTEPKIRRLELVPTEELIEELSARYDTVVFVAQAPLVQEASIHKTCIRWAGDLLIALSMISRAAHKINKRVDEREEDEDDTD